MFALAVILGRGFRYSLEGWLARTYGQRAADLMADHMTAVSLWVLGTAVVATAVYIGWRRRVQRLGAA
jgi:hypothetical protein